MENVSVTLTGKTMADVAKQAATFFGATGATLETKTSGATKTATKKTAPAVIEDDLLGEEETLEADAEETTDELENFDDAADDVEEAPAKKTAASTKKTKLTEKDVNTVALKHAKENGRPETLKILKAKFKVGSITELKPEQYAKAIEALKV